MTDKIPNYKEWLTVNSSRFSQYDYIHGQITQYDVPADIVTVVSKIVWPEFLILGECIFIKDIFNNDKYQSLVNASYSVRDIEYWMNLVNISGMFGEGNESEAAEFCVILKSTWKIKFMLEHPSLVADVEIVDDDGDGFIYLCRKLGDA